MGYQGRHGIYHIMQFIGTIRRQRESGPPSTSITDNGRFELDEVRHWPRDHIGRRPDPVRSRDAIAA
ncbi:Riboflavin kinase [Trichinella spiralis]|uniref:Riboflavin kinase n=1 Tax=Trichinella spiralis TaxID=6334 RepID=A0ABR3KBU7_TRISP